MTAVIHHGAPGSYKTFSIVQRVLIPALQEGRMVITNIRGFDSIDRIREVLNIEIPDSAQILYVEPNELGYQTLAKFFHWAPAGALIAMDEGQRVYPTRTKRFDELDQPADIVICDAENNPLIDIKTGQPIYRPSTVENAFDQHRHFNWDIYISTPNISKIHSEIRKTVEWGYRHRDNTGLLPWFKNTWTEFRHDSEQSGKSVAHYSGAPKRYKADKKIFQCYQSTATGSAKTSNENISIFRDPKLRALGLVFFVAVSIFIYQSQAAYDRLMGGAASSSDGTIAVPAQAAVSPVPLHHHDIGNRNVIENMHPRTVPVNPIETAQLFYTGSINNRFMFEALWPDGSVTFLGLPELERFGYIVKERIGAVVAFDLNGKLVYALPKPRAPIQERVATMERSATEIGAFGI
ncbi:zonular occludens toxin family protein [Cellvibrio sp. UBA7661]|uniref:zonular occludens toxin family protein n=1 Tax=Cellvibrio sp. UBA7661 TaxID=1946311 RepID=UPI002F34F993